jgi:hypothetical protein
MGSQVALGLPDFCSPPSLHFLFLFLKVKLAGQPTPLKGGTVGEQKDGKYQNAGGNRSFKGESGFWNRNVCAFVMYCYEWLRDSFGTASKGRRSTSKNV